jgi:hypothetical protein
MKMMIMMIKIIIIIMFVRGNDDAQARAVKWIRRLIVWHLTAVPDLTPVQTRWDMWWAKWYYFFG